MIDVVAAVNDDAVLCRNLLRSPLLARADVSLHLQRGYASASLAYRAAMTACRSDIVVFAHQDVYLPSQWEDRLMHNVARLAHRDPRWAVLGIYGVRPDGVHVGCVWSSGLDTVVGMPFDEPAAVESIDELLIVLRRSSGVEFDAALPGYHVYATDLVQAALSRGHGAYAVYAPVVHNSRPSLFLGADYFEAYGHVARKWRHRLPIHNNVATVVGPGLSYLRLRARQKLNEWRFSHRDRRLLDRHYDCVGVARRLGYE